MLSEGSMQSFGESLGRQIDPMTGRPFPDIPLGSFPTTGKAPLQGLPSAIVLRPVDSGDVTPYPWEHDTGAPDYVNYKTR